MLNGEAMAQSESDDEVRLSDRWAEEMYADLYPEELSLARWLAFLSARHELPQGGQDDH